MVLPKDRLVPYTLLLQCDLSLHGDTLTEPGVFHDSESYTLTAEVIMHDTGGTATSSCLSPGIPDRAVRKHRLHGEPMLVSSGCKPWLGLQLPASTNWWPAFRSPRGL